LAFGSLALIAMLCSLVPGQAQDADDGQTIHLFYSPSCQHCHEVRSLVARLASEYPGLSIEEYNLTDPDNIELMVQFYTRYQVPEDKWGGTMAAFVGDRWWGDSEKILAELAGAVAQIAGATPAVAPASGEAPAPAGIGNAQARDKLVELFERFGVLAVAGAGLADGVNPCALAALIFLISYLNFAKRGPREILATGLVFAAGVFLAYLGVGVGLFRALQALAGFALASKLLYPAMALATLALTGYSLRDYLRARAGRVRDMTLTLPRGMIRLSHGTIRGLLGRPGFLLLAFVAGLAISLLELLCTGQIYVPVLMAVLSTEGLRTRAFGLLVLYVTMFTLPIIAVTVLAYTGVRSERLAATAREHTAATKLGLTIVFAVLAAYLVYFSVRLFVP